MVLPLGNTQKITQAGAAILALKSRQDITAIFRRHYPEPPLTLNFQNVRSPNQVAVAIPTILIFTLVAENHTDACARPNGYSAKVSSDRYVKTLILGFYDPRKIEIRVAFSVEINVKSVQHFFALRCYSAGSYQEFRTEPDALVSCKIFGNFQPDRIMLERKIGRRSVSESI